MKAVPAGGAVSAAAVGVIGLLVSDEEDDFTFFFFGLESLEVVTGVRFWGDRRKAAPPCSPAVRAKAEPAMVS